MNKIIQKISDSKITNEVMKRVGKENPNILSEDIVVVSGAQWSDDFEPNGLIQSNRGLVLIKTLIFVSNTNTKNDIINTYPLSIGFKSSSHDCVKE